MLDFTQLLFQRPCCRLAIKRPWPLSLLALLAFCCCIVGSASLPHEASQRLPAAVSGHPARKFLHLHVPETRKWSVETLQLQLERPNYFDDKLEALMAAIYSDQARRDRLVSRLQRRVLAQEGGNAAPAANGSSSSGSKAGLASLNVISGSSVGSGEYFATMGVGTPPQKLYLIADTGSDLTWVKCSSSSSSSSPFSTPCAATASACSNTSTNQTFDPAASSSFSPLSCLSSQCATWFFPPTCDGLSRHCKFSYSYTDQSSTTGSLVFESVTLGESVQANLLLGCGRQYEGPNFDKAGGVIGLGQGPLSLASQLAAQSAYSNKFSYCLADFFGPSSSTGLLAFGESAFATTPQYTPLIQNPFAATFYYVGVEGVKVGGVLLAIPADVWGIDGQGNGGTIVDSGTTLAQFAQPAYEVIREAFRQLIPYPLAESVEGLDLCYNVDAVSNPRFPEFAILFQGNLLFQPPQDNFFTDAAPGVKCLAMQEVPPSSFSVVGNLLQQNFHIEFDRLHNRLGLAPTDCANLHST